MTTLPEKGTKCLGAERYQNVITLHGVEGFDKLFQETYIQGVPGGMCETSGECSLC